MLQWWRERRSQAEERAILIAEIKPRIRTAFGLGETDTVAVNEIACPDPGCPDIETVILIMRPGQKTQAVKIALPLAKVSGSDLAQAAARSSSLTHAESNGALPNP
ncbi:hypothetical protein [Microvirga tunisiensis]|uniref:Nitrate reductase n=1 Tax=Microvirga tunisiensis TaxID=2108360 RepID=A0A5N7MQG6_9HYPH|nr:hypothetical protein [Microvirga tunisiensis]MPR11171.1 hypothetical protein [Microvirga tunisiensis]MPR29262.1 hypothetical protein [Microvirga tunisiensis]